MRQICLDLLIVLQRGVVLAAMVCVGLLGISSVQADTLRVSLPEVLGAYSVSTSKVAAFDLGTSIDSVVGVSISLSGTMSPGIGIGDGVECPVGEPFAWPTQMTAYMDPDESPGLWLATFSASGEFNDTTLFNGLIHPTWDFLLDGQGEVEVYLSPLIIMCGVMLTPPSAEIYSAELIIETAGLSTSIVCPNESEDDDRVPGSYSLSQNYPNPFNPTTEIAFEIPTASFVEIRIYNMLGQKIRTLVSEQLSAGQKVVTWDGSDDRRVPVASGTYFYRISSDGYAEAKKMLLLK